MAARIGNTVGVMSDRAGDLIDLGSVHSVNADRFLKLSYLFGSIRTPDKKNSKHKHWYPTYNSESTIFFDNK